MEGKKYDEHTIKGNKFKSIPIACTSEIYINDKIIKTGSSDPFFNDYDTHTCTAVVKIRKCCQQTP